MKNSQLSAILKGIDLRNCEEIIPNHIYYINKDCTLSTSTWDNGRKYYKGNYEFLIIAPNQIKKGIILRCSTIDLHWYVYNQFRGEHALSDALRTNVINHIWPENKVVTCCYEPGENREAKYQMTKHLARLANLEVIEK